MVRVKLLLLFILANSYILSARARKYTITTSSQIKVSSNDHWIEKTGSLLTPHVVRSKNTHVQITVNSSLSQMCC